MLGQRYLRRVRLVFPAELDRADLDLPEARQRDDLPEVFGRLIGGLDGFIVTSFPLGDIICVGAARRGEVAACIDISMPVHGQGADVIVHARTQCRPD